MYSKSGLLTTSILAARPLSVLGHMLLAQPPHIGQINNSPLNGPNASGGGNYPCKYTGDPSFYDNPVVTTIPLGSNYTVEFTGSAVHGGGSCQFSLSKDLAPTASSSFKVIYSIEGGCPARNTPGNLGSDASMADPFTYPFTMPPDLEPGQYTFAWTWINKVGNREFYMNCAAVDVTATSEYQGTPGYYDTLPEIAVVNVNGVDCVSEPDNGMGSFKYQDPGAFVEINDSLQTVDKQCFAPITDPNTTQGSQSNTSSSTTSSPQNGESSSSDSTETTDDTAAQTGGSDTSDSTNGTAAQASNQQSVTAGVFASSSSAAPSGFSTVITSPSQASDSPAAADSTCPPSWQSCTGEGFFCVDQTHFGLCSFGCMPQVQELADGVGCHVDTNTLFDLRYSR